MEDERMSESVFVAHSPYHCLLGFAIASSQGERNYLFLDNMFDRTNAEILLDFFHQTEVFDEVLLFEGKFTYGRKKSGREHQLSILRNIRRAKQFLRTKSIDYVYTSIDNKEFDQAVMHYCKTWFNSDCVHVEDGAVSYSSEMTGWHAFRNDYINKAVFRLLFGFWWENVAVYGQSKFVDRVCATHPEHIRTELQEHPTEQIPKDPVLTLAGTDPLIEYFRSYELSGDDVESIDGIFVLPHSNLVKRNPDYKRTIQKMFDFLSKMDSEVGVKYHPRDDDPDSIPAVSEYDLLNLPSEVPIELIYVTNQDIDFVVGDVSTSLITAEWLLVDVSTYSFGRLLSGPIDGNQTLLENYSQIGVKNVTDIEYIVEALA